MKNKIFYSVVLIAFVSVSITSCFNDLDLNPKYGIDAADVYEDPANYVHVLAKLYAGLAISGNEGPAGNPDILGIDEGFSQYLRVLWNLQELPTDEAKCAWSDPGIPELNKMQWSSTNSFVNAMYYRIFFQIPLCNEFIREAADDKMSERGFSDADQQLIRGYKTEARFLRALSYFHAMDLFGTVPFITEENEVGAFYPDPISRADLFNYLESELIAIEAELPAPHANEYGRADKAAAWTMLARIYLNAEVYSGTPRYNDCKTWCEKIIAEGGYTLEPVYDHLFVADNNNSNEIIFPITFDGRFTQTFGGTTFLTHASIGGDSMSTIDFSYFGVEFGWGGNRATPEFANLFPDADDSRNMFFTFGQTLDFTADAELSTFVVGYPVAKWRNVLSTSLAEFTGSIDNTTLTVTDVASGNIQVGQNLAGYGVNGTSQIASFISGTGGIGTYEVTAADTVSSEQIFAAIPGSDESGDYADIDFPLFRYADVLLMYAECAVRGAGDAGLGLTYVNMLRERAYGDALHNLGSIDPTTVLDERGRELQWEGYRRTDLIRYGLFTSASYIWAFKGGSFDGAAVGDYLNLYPLPAADVIANPNLTQNPGY
ncbi:MAG: RagB/SusD family nutrient uptake outer membrane protein [Chitinophagales bacterium]